MKRWLLPLAISLLIIPGCQRAEKVETASPSVIVDPIKRAGQTENISAQISLTSKDRMRLTIKTTNDIRLDDQQVDIRLEVSNQSIPFPFVSFSAKKMGEIRTYTSDTTVEDEVFNENRLPVLVIDAGAGRGIEIPLEIIR
ncbi:hypothetical protein ASF99_09340 [Exiguobacterium sp. Leaf187]|uniref:Uncharacterized protein n=1 Tax=Exiguobacterium indicum TaxID=296995 RepID=A0A0V8GIA8_9BACL|nr:MULTISPECIES: hypothetical protein [Exiguobacterium]KOP30367.1 hypothetical protein ADM98_16190 [Exiguobacterium sp. BMC-KP]KQS20077.1 hypothetical protein ASF99_09340 [Exiguobacterium sp. Leaf187]KSU49914.1 hypothetical protein AS033_00675 [Exiguobacterium enclense]KTR28255.1 hypothetical protein RSA11_02220 [Exiguobacterium indicum]MCQ4089118.1 hypothetical protein [Exiguobacterium sp. LL15]